MFSKLLAVALPMAALLAACGGGGSSSPDMAPASPDVAPASPAGSASAPLASSTSLAQQCVVPRAGTGDRLGTIDTEKSWVRSFMDETYLWYKDIPVVDPAGFTLAANGNSVLKTLDAYFQALKTKKTTPSGKLVDQFSFTVATADLQKQQAGISSGFGMHPTAFPGWAVPRVVRIVYVEPGSPAELAGVQRGDTITSVDGVDINDTTPAGMNALYANLLPPTPGKTTRFGLLAAGAAVPREVSITAQASVAVTPVPLTKVITDGASTVGYLVFNSFAINNAEKQLIDAVTQLKSANVNELVLDLRYNSGGYLDIANELAWMIGSPAMAGKTFESLTCNDKNQQAFCNLTYSFYQAAKGFSAPMGQPLPQLGLRRVFVLTSGATCSASESVINGLSPYVQVIRIGSTTCGKPYGFSYRDNCGTSYAAMQFKTVNAQGFGDYADGMSPSCSVADDLAHQRGDAAELMLSGALTYMRTGACPAPTPSGGKTRALSALQGSFTMEHSPMDAVRVLGGPGVPH